MNKNLLAISIGGLLVIGALGFVFGRLTTPVQPTQTQQYGSVASPVIASPYLNVGGVSEWYAHTEAMSQGTTTACALLSPAATSTLQYFEVRFDVASGTTATVVDLAKSTNPTSSSTIIASPTNIASGAIAQIVSTTTSYVFAPNTYVLAKVSGGVGTYTPTGGCLAKWVQLAY